MVLGSQGTDGIGKLVNGMNKVIYTLPADLHLRFLHLQPSLMQAHKLSVPPFYSFLSGLNGFCYNASAFGDGSAHFIM